MTIMMAIGKESVSCFMGWAFPFPFPFLSPSLSSSSAAKAVLISAEFMSELKLRPPVAHKACFFLGEEASARAGRRLFGPRRGPQNDQMHGGVCPALREYLSVN